MPTQISSTTPDVLFKSESHKLHDAYTVKASTTVKKGQLVKLNGADGTIEPAAAGEANLNIIGFSLHNAEAGSVATIMSKGYAVLNAVADGTVPAGPVKAGAFGTDYPIVSADTVTAANQIGWALDSVADGENCRVLVKA